jgi:hypothetical protein
MISVELGSIGLHKESYYSSSWDLNGKGASGKVDAEIRNLLNTVATYNLIAEVNQIF